MRRPISLFILVFLLIGLSVGSLITGVSLLLDPTGKRLGLPSDLIQELLFTDYSLHSFILILLFGLLPAFLVYPLMERPHWKNARNFSIFKNRYWAWSVSLYIALAIILTNDILIFLAGYRHPIQSAIALYGFVMLVVTLSPALQRHFRRSGQKAAQKE